MSFTDDQIRRYGKALKVKGRLRLSRDRYPDRGPEGITALQTRLVEYLDMPILQTREGDMHVLTLNNDSQNVGERDG